MRPVALWLAFESQKEVVVRHPDGSREVHTVVCGPAGVAVRGLPHDEWTSGLALAW